MNQSPEEQSALSTLVSFSRNKKDNETSARMGNHGENLTRALDEEKSSTVASAPRHAAKHSPSARQAQQKPSATARKSRLEADLPPLITPQRLATPPVSTSGPRRKRKYQSLSVGTPTKRDLADVSEFGTLLPLKKRRKLLSSAHSVGLHELHQKHHNLDHDERMRRLNTTPTPTTPTRFSASTPKEPCSEPQQQQEHSSKQVQKRALHITIDRASVKNGARKKKSRVTKRAHTVPTPTSSGAFLGASAHVQKLSLPGATPSATPTTGTPSTPQAHIFASLLSPSIAHQHLTQAQLDSLLDDINSLIANLKPTLNNGIKRGTVKKRESLAQKKIQYALEYPLQPQHLTHLLGEVNSRLGTDIKSISPAHTTQDSFRINSFYQHLKESHPNLQWRKLFSSDLPPAINQDFAVPYRLAALFYTHLFPEQTSIIYSSEDREEARENIFGSRNTVNDQKLAEKAVCCHCLLQLIPGRGRRGSGNLPRHKKKTCRAIGIRKRRAASDTLSTSTPTTANTPTASPHQKKKTQA